MPIHPRPRPGHDQLARHPLRPRRARSRRSPRRSSEQIFPQPGLGRARPRRDLGDAERRRGRSARPGAGATRRDVAAIGITNQRETTVVWDREHRPPGLQRDRLAGPPHRRVLRPAEGRRPRGADRRAHRPGDRRLLLRQQGRVDPRQRRRAPGPAPTPGGWPSARSTPGWSGT